MTNKIDPYPWYNRLVRVGEPFTEFSQNILSVSSNLAVVTNSEVQQ